MCRAAAQVVLVILSSDARLCEHLQEQEYTLRRSIGSWWYLNRRKSGFFKVPLALKIEQDCTCHVDHLGVQECNCGGQGVGWVGPADAKFPVLRSLRKIRASSSPSGSGC
jgi:hypothetical protein